MPQKVAAFLAGALLIAATGCTTSRPEFPLGLFGVPPESFAEVKEAGFNIVTGPADLAFLDAAQEAGLGVVAFSGAMQLSTNAVIRERVNRLDKHPALWAWYLVDEPDLHRIPPDDVARAKWELGRLTFKPGMLVLMSGSAAEHYGAHADYLGVDFYPVPWAPLSQFGKEMKLGRVHRGSEPCFAILQAFNWEAFPGLIASSEPLRTPTLEEVHCMVYMALAAGADGLFFYSFQAGDWYLPDHDLWPDLKGLAAEVNALRPLFKAERLWWAPALEYVDEGEDMYNEVREGKITLRLLQVKKGNETVPPGRYVLAINTTADVVPFRLQLPDDQGDEVPVTGRDMVQPLYRSVLRKDFSPYEVVIYGPLASGSETRAK